MPKSQHLQPFLAGDERVCLLARQMDQTVAGADLVRLALLPRQPGAAEDVGDLLLLALAVRWGRPLAWKDLDAVDADGHGARCTAQIGPICGKRPLLEELARSLVPVGDHQASSPSSASSSRPTSPTP